MMTRSFRVLPLLALTGAAFAQVPQFQTTTTTTRIDGAIAIDAGNSSYGANVAASGEAEKSVTRIGSTPIAATLRLADGLVGRVRLDGVNREAVYVSRFAEVGGSVLLTSSSASFSAGYTIRVGGNTIFSPTVNFNSSYEALSWNPATNTLTIFSTSDWVETPLFGVSVNLNARANAALGAQLVLDAQPLSASIVGNLRGVCTANANASISLACASVGVDTDFRLLDTRITPTVTLSYPGVMSGTLGYRVEAFRALGQVFASLCGVNASVTFVNLSAGLAQGTIPYN